MMSDEWQKLNDQKMVAKQPLIFAFFPIFEGGCPFGPACLPGYSVPLCEMKKFEFSDLLVFIPRSLSLYSERTFISHTSSRIDDWTIGKLGGCSSWFMTTNSKLFLAAGWIENPFGPFQTLVNRHCIYLNNKTAHVRKLHLYMRVYIYSC